MKYRKVGTSDVTVSEVMMGCWAIADGIFWGKQDEADSVATIKAALAAGVNSFDTAENYGDGYSEEVVGKTLRKNRGEVVIATKVSAANLSAKHVAAACEGSLRRLQTDHIDLYQIHWPNHSIPLTETLDAMAMLRDTGKIRAIGVSNFGVRDLSEALAAVRVESNQIPYSLLWRAIEFEIQPLCVDKHVSILSYSPLAQGLLTGKFSSAREVPLSRQANRLFLKPRVRKAAFAALDRVRAVAERLGRPMAEVSIAWLLKQPAVGAVIAGARKPNQITANAAASDLDLTDDVVAELGDATADVKALVGENPDLWSPGPLTHYR